MHYPDDSLNGESKEFAAVENDMHFSDEDLEKFYDNVNSVSCVSTTPGNQIL